VPFTVRVIAGPPACAMDGLRLVIVRFTAPVEIVNARPLDTTPFVLTVTVAVPCAAMRLPSTVPDSWLVLPKNVARGVPFQKIAEFVLNPDPFTVRVKADPPAGAEEGLRLVMLAPGVIVNVAVFETVPLLLTETMTFPCVVNKLAPMGALT